MTVTGGCLKKTLIKQKARMSSLLVHLLTKKAASIADEWLIAGVRTILPNITNPVVLATLIKCIWVYVWTYGGHVKTYSIGFSFFVHIALLYNKLVNFTE